MRAIADAIGDPKLERVVVQKSARIGFSTVLAGAIAHYVCDDPAPILHLSPTEADCRFVMVDEIEGIFLDSPAIRDSLPMPHPGRSDRNTLLHRIFPGGSLKLVAGKAPRNLRRHGARILLIDEADAIASSSEGDAISLAEKRTLAHADRHIVVGSTPLDEDTSTVCRLYAQSDQRIFEVPCPECGAFSEILWDDIEWPPDHPELAAWRCPHCHDVIPEDDKPRMVARGRWRVLRPEVTNHAGFKVSTLVSLLPNAAWGKLATEYEQVKDDPVTRRTFDNTILAKPWKDSIDDIDEDELSARAEDFGLETIPAEVSFITAGVDVQVDRLEVTIVGHADNGTVFILEHRVFYGQPAEATDDVWRALDVLLFKERWQHPKGGRLRIDAAGVDASDGNSYDSVMKYCRPRLKHRIFGLKGAAGLMRPPMTPTQTHSHGRLFICGVDSIKNHVLTRLKRPGLIRFASNLPAHYYPQLVSERRVIRRLAGKPVIRFERIPGRDAEALDCLTYAIAVRAALQLTPAMFEQRAAALHATEPGAPAPVPAGSPLAAPNVPTTVIPELTNLGGAPAFDEDAGRTPRDFRGDAPGPWIGRRRRWFD